MNPPGPRLLMEGTATVSRPPRASGTRDPNSWAYCVTALAVALLASFMPTAVFSPAFSVYFTVT